MEDIIEHLNLSLADELLSKAEKKTLKELVADRLLSPDQLNFLRSKIYELASQKINGANQQFIIQWIRDANSALLSVKQEDKSDAFFSPGDACRETIMQQLTSATSTVKICVFTISDDAITNSILAAHKKGLDVKVISDNDKSLDMGSDIARLAREGIAVRMDSTPNHMHHKFMVVDNRNLITGSYNWTQSAARYNHENILLTYETGVVKSFLKQFEQLWREMQDYR